MRGVTPATRYILSRGIIQRPEDLSRPGGPHRSRTRSLHDRSSRLARRQVEEVSFLYRAELSSMLPRAALLPSLAAASPCMPLSPLGELLHWQPTVRAGATNCVLAVPSHQCCRQDSSSSTFAAAVAGTCLPAHVLRTDATDAPSGAPIIVGYGSKSTRGWSKKLGCQAFIADHGITAAPDEVWIDQNECWKGLLAWKKCYKHS